jgi:aryl-alcohol dehydrogenase-like predicted oxidoreductase
VAASPPPEFTERPAPAPRPASRLGLGLAALGRPAYINVGHDQDFPEGRSPQTMERHAHAVLDAAWQLGVRYLDAARSYGRAEAFLRSWLTARGVAPGAVVVGSKWGYRYVGEWRLEAERHEVKDHSVAALRAQLAETEALLAPWLALYQIHSATLETGVLEDGAVLDALAALRARGVEIGLSTSGTSQAETIRRALAIEREGRPLFAAVQATWNVLERSAEAALVEARAAGRTVIVKEALANGRLTARGDAGRGGPLAALAAGLGATPDAVAIAAALSRPWADLVLLGASTVEQLRSNAAAVALDPAVLAEALEGGPLGGAAEPSAAYWERRAALPWR